MQGPLAKACEGSTTIFITRRLAAARNADRIAILDGGRVAACGTHVELLAHVATCVAPDKETASAAVAFLKIGDDPGTASRPFNHHDD